MIQEFNDSKTKIINTEKSDLTKNCFWIPEKTPDIKDESNNKVNEYIVYI